MAKIALIHDHLVQCGGAEQVLKALSEIKPEAPIFTIVSDKKTAEYYFGDRKIQTSFVQRMPFGVRLYQWWLPLMSAAVENLNLSAYDTVISSASSFAKGVLTKPGATHICYCHTPTRYLWSDSHNYLKELKVNWLIKKILPLTLRDLRLWDRLAAERVDYFIANSKTVQARINKYYNRDSVVIYPPVETARFSISSAPKKYFLAGGRLVPYKRIDLAVKACSRLNAPLIVFGSGPEEKYLKKIAKENVIFLGKISDAHKARLFSNCIAYINPQEEDFGITAIEAMASGRPVIAYKKGGALETIKAGETGEFFEEQIWEDLADKLMRFDHTRYHPEAIRAHALSFDTAVFKRRMEEFLKKI